MCEPIKEGKCTCTCTVLMCGCGVCQVCGRKCEKSEWKNGVGLAEIILPKNLPQQNIKIHINNIFAEDVMRLYKEKLDNGDD